MPIHPQFNARHDLRLPHILQSKTVGYLLLQNFLDLRLPGLGNAKSALDNHPIAAAPHGIAHLNAFLLIECFDPADEFIHNPFLQIGVRQIAQGLTRRGI